MLRRFLLRRFLLSLLSILGVCILVFLFLHLLPGDPVDNLLGEQADVVAKAQMRARLGLDQPLYIQFGRFLVSIADGTLGHSFQDPTRTVASLISHNFPWTIELAIASLLLAVLLAFPLGIIAALRAGRVADDV